MVTGKRWVRVLLGIVALFCLLLAVGMVLLPVLVSRPREAIRRHRHHDAIDRMLEELELGNIAFNAPRQMNIREEVDIQLLLDLEKPIDELKQWIEARGEKEGARIRVSDRMEARLTGLDFAITAIMPETTAVSRRESTEWRWKVRPLSAGPHSLHLTLSVILDVNGVPTPRVIRTFDRYIQVDVTWGQRLDLFFERNWQWLWATVLVPIVGWLLRNRKQSQPVVHRANT
jgi:hypothetical protein